MTKISQIFLILAIVLLAIPILPYNIHSIDNSSTNQNSVEENLNQIKNQNIERNTNSSNLNSWSSYNGQTTQDPLLTQNDISNDKTTVKVDYNSRNNTIKDYSVDITQYEAELLVGANYSSKFSQYRYVTADDSENIYVVDREFDDVRKFDSSGNFLNYITHSIGYGVGIEYHNVTDTIWISDNSGSQLEQWDQNGTQLDSYNTCQPNGIDLVFSDDGHQYIYIACQNGFQKFNLTSEAMVWTDTTHPDFYTQLSVAPNGEIYAVLTTGDIESFSTNTTGATFDRTVTSLYNFQDVSYRDNDTIYAVRLWERVYRINKTGDILSQLTATGNSDGNLNFGLTVQYTRYTTDKHVYVTDLNTGRIQEINDTSLSAIFVQKFGTQPNGNGELFRPKGLAIDQINGDIYVADADNDKVQRFDNDGNFITSWSHVNLGTIAVDDSYVYVSKLQTNAAGLFITKYDKSGNLQHTIGESPSHSGNGGMAVDRFNGWVYLAFRSSTSSNWGITKYDTSGNILLRFGETGPSIPNEYQALAVDLSGNIYAANFEDILKYDSNGNLIDTITSVGNINTVQEMEIDSSNNIILENSYRITIINQDGILLNEIGVNGFEELGNYKSILGMGILGNDIYIADNVQSKIERITYYSGITPLAVIGNFPVADDLNYLEILTNSQSQPNLIISQTQVYDFSFFDAQDINRMGIIFKAGNGIEYDFDLNIDLDDDAIYRSNELKLHLEITFTSTLIDITITTFDTGTNTIKTSTVNQAQTISRFETTVIKLDYIWAETDFHTTNIDSIITYTSPIQHLHTIAIEVFEYGIPLTVYTDWEFASITPSATTTYSSSDSHTTTGHYDITNTIPVTYIIEFIAGQGWGINSPHNITVAPVIDVSSDFLSCISFECGNSTLDLSSITENEDVSWSSNATIVSDGAISLRMGNATSNPSGSEGFNIQTSERGDFYATFDTFIESGSTWTGIEFYFRVSDSAWDSLVLDSIVYDRWQKHIVNFTLSGDEVANNRNLIISFRSGDGVAFIDNLRFWKVDVSTEINGVSSRQFKTSLVVLDGFDNPNLDDHRVKVELFKQEGDVLLNTWEVQSQLGLSFQSTDSLTEQGYYLKFNSTSYNVTYSNFYFTPLPGSQYISLTKENSITFDDLSLSSLIDLDADTESFSAGVMSVTSTGSDFWAYYKQGFASSDYSITARMKHTGGIGSHIGISFYDIPTSSVTSDDTFFIRAGTSQTIFRIGGIETTPVFISSTNTWYTIRIDVTADQVKIYIDDVLLATRINTNPLTNPYFSVYGADSNVDIDFVRFSAIGSPVLNNIDSQTYMSSINNTGTYELHSDGAFAGFVNDLDLISLNLTSTLHNLTIIPISRSTGNHVYIADIISRIVYLYEGSIFLVNVNQLGISDTIVSTYLTSSRNGNYSVYENNTVIATGNFVGSGTSILVTRNLAIGTFIEFAIEFQNETNSVWFNTTYSNSLVVEDSNIYIRYIDGIGDHIPFETFNTYYRFDSDPYIALGRDFLQFPSSSTNLNLYLNNSFGTEIKNVTTTEVTFFSVIINAHEIFFTNQVNQSLLVQFKIPSLSWSESVGHWVGINSFRMLTVFNGTYDFRILAEDGLTVLQTSTLDVTQDIPFSLSEQTDLVLFDYDWDVVDGNVTITLNTNYRDSLVRVFDNGNFINTFNENGSISWNIPTGLNASQVFFYVERNITKYGAVEEQSILRVFAYSIGVDDFDILISDVGWVETTTYVNITVEVNQVIALVLIWHDGVVNETGSNERNYQIFKNPEAGSHNFTIAIYWQNATGYYFTDWYVLDYWVAAYYSVSLDVIPNSDGLKLVSTQINFNSFNVYLEGELVSPLIPDPFQEQETDNINVSLIAEGRLWIRNTAWNLSLQIRDKWDMLLFSTQLDLSAFIYKVIELPLVYLTITSTRVTDTEVQMYRWNVSSSKYVLGPLIGVPANSTINPVWVIAGLYTVRVFDIIRKIEVINEVRTATLIYTEDEVIGDGYPINIGDRGCGGTQPIDSDIVCTPWSSVNLTPDYFSYGTEEDRGSLESSLLSSGAFGIFELWVRIIIAWIENNPFLFAIFFLIFLGIWGFLIKLWTGRKKTQTQEMIEQQEEIISNKIGSPNMENVSQRDSPKPQLVPISERFLPENRRKRKNNGGLTPISSRNNKSQQNQLQSIVQRQKDKIKRDRKNRRINKL